MFNKIKEIFNKIKQDLSEEETTLQKEILEDDFSEETFYVQNVQYAPEEWDIVNDCKQRLQALGVEEIEIDGICVQYWEEITEAFELMENTFTCLRGYVKRIQLVEVENSSLMFIRIPVGKKCKENKHQYKYMTKPTLNVGIMFLDAEATEQEIRELCNDGRSKLNSVYATTIHELSHFLEQVITIVVHGFNFYDEYLTEDNLIDEASSFGNHRKDSIDITKILEKMNMPPIKQSIKEFWENSSKHLGIEDVDELTEEEDAKITKEYFEYVDTILKGYHYAFTDDSEFFAEMIATKMVYGDKADDFVLQYYNIFESMYSYLFNHSFEKYKEAKNKPRYHQYLKSLS